MKVFISWSGETSQKYAEALKEWLERCIQSVEVFFSPEDIEKGDNWNTKLSNELKDTNYGIICLTSENVSAPWLHFESGALSKTFDSKVMVLAFNINISEIVGPMKSFQATRFEEKDMFKLLQSINNSQERPLTESKLRDSFDAFWPRLQNRVEEIKNATPNKNKTEKDSSKQGGIKEVLDEILQMIRNQNATISNPEKLLPISYLSAAISQFNSQGVDNGNESNKATLDYVLSELYRFTDYVISDNVFLFNDSKAIDFLGNYHFFISKICRDNDYWGLRFSSQYRKLREKYVSRIK